jgi:hypothetical protein
MTVWHHMQGCTVLVGPDAHLRVHFRVNDDTVWPRIRLQKQILRCNAPGQHKNCGVAIAERAVYIVKKSIVVRPVAEVKKRMHSHLIQHFGTNG